MRLTLGHVDELTDQVLSFAAQLGLSSIQLHCPRGLDGSEGYWRLADLERTVDTCDGYGLKLEGIENVPPSHLFGIVIGAANSGELLDNYCRTIENMGKAEIPVLGYNFMPDYVWRTTMEASGRGGALVSAFSIQDAQRGNALADYALTPRVQAARIDADTLWDNHERFLRTTLPVAESAGVILALHPDDPPLKSVTEGTARIISSIDDLLQARRLAGGSSAWAVNLCLGTVSEMGGAAAVHEAIDTFGPAGDIASVHFRDVQGHAGDFTECFLGDGNYDPAQALRHLIEVGFDGFLIDDHVPAMVYDPDTWGSTTPETYCSRGRAYTLGLIEGIMRGLDAPDPLTVRNA